MGTNRLRRCALLWVLVLFGCRQDPRSEFERMVAGLRPCLARFTVTKTYQPCGGLPAAERPFISCLKRPGVFSEQGERVRKLALAFDRRLEIERTAADLQARGWLDLVYAQRPADLERPVGLFREALSLEPDRADLAVDLAAVQGWRYRLENHPWFLLQALESVLVARSLQPDHPAALYDHALILEELGMVEGAIEVWDQQLRSPEIQRGWLDEIERHRERLLRGRPTVAWDEIWNAYWDGALAANVLVEEEAQRLRLALETEGFPRLATAVIAGNAADVAKVRAGLDELAREISRRTGDALLRDALNSFSTASAPLELARAHLDYARGRQLFEAKDFDESVTWFSRAHQAFVAADSPFAGLAAVFLASCTIRDPSLGEELGASAEQQLERLRARFPAESYPSLIGLADWRSCIQLAVQGSLSQARGFCQSALSLFQQSGLDQDVASVRFQLSEIFEEAGLLEQAWQMVFLGLRSRDRIFQPRWLHYLSIKASTIARKAGYSHASEALFEQAVADAATSPSRAILISEALVGRGLTSERSGDFQAATEFLERAREFAADISDSTHRHLVAAQIDKAQGRILSHLDPVRALPLLERAFAYYAGISSETPHIALVEIARDRAKAHGRLGLGAEAREDLLRSVQIVERHQETLADEELSLSYFVQTRAAFDQLIEMELRAGADLEKVLIMADRSRARELTRSIDRASRVKSSAQLRKALSEGMVVVHMTQLEEELLLIVLGAGTQRMQIVPVSRDEADERVRELREQILAGGSERPSAADELGRLLLAPFTAELRVASTLIFVPDRAWFDVPFGVIGNPESGSLLVTDHTLTVAHSAAALLEDLSSRRQSDIRDRPLFVGVSSTPLATSAGLPPLREVASEVGKVQRLYPNSKTYLGAAAQRQVVMRELAGATLFHFAGHAVSDSQFPLRSVLLLPSERDDEGGISGLDLQANGLGHLQLAVLAACSTQGSIVFENEGPIGLAWTFLRAGTDRVVATLWPVEDEPTAHLMMRFHQALAAGSTPAQALRRAQLALIESSDPGLDHPKSWSGFVHFGIP